MNETINSEWNKGRALRDEEDDLRWAHLTSEIPAVSDLHCLMPEP